MGAISFILIKTLYLRKGRGLGTRPMMRERGRIPPFSALKKILLAILKESLSRKKPTIDS
jgi:hypothetical protein